MVLVVLVGGVETVHNGHRIKASPHMWFSCKPLECIFGVYQESFTIEYVYNSRITTLAKKEFFILFYMWGLVARYFHIWDVGF